MGGDPKNFDLNQVATYFVVNLVPSHWDGFFNNHFTYHDRKGTVNGGCSPGIRTKPGASMTPAGTGFSSTCRSPSAWPEISHSGRRSGKV